MTDGFQELYPSKGGNKVDVEVLTVGAETVERQRVQLAGALATEIARVLGAAPAGTEFGLIVRNIPSGTQNTQPVAPALNREASGTLGALNATVEIDATGAGCVFWEVDAGLTGTVAFEGSLDGTNFTTIDGTADGFSSGLVFNGRALTGGSNRGILQGGLKKVRLRASIYTSGSASARLGSSDSIWFRGKLSASTAAIGKLSANAGINIGTVEVFGAAGTPLYVVGAVQEDTPATTFPVEVAGVSEDAGDTAPAHLVSSEGDVVQLLADRNGALYTRGHPPRIWTVPIDASTNGNNVLKATPGAGLSLYVTDFFIESAGIVTPTLKRDGAGTNVTILPFQAGVAGTRWGPFSFASPLKLTANQSLDLALSAAINVRGIVNGFTAA